MDELNAVKVAINAGKFVGRKAEMDRTNLLAKLDAAGAKADLGTHIEMSTNNALDRGRGGSARHRPFLLIPATMLLVLLAGCTPPAFTLPPGPQAYREGYSDGCDAGYAVAGSPLYRPLDAAYPPRSEETYASGWKSGFDSCKRSFNRIRKTVTSVLGPPL